MDKSTHRPAPPPSVIERCAATDGLYGGCHGASASGANDLTADNPAESLRDLADDMHLSYERWVGEQEAVVEARRSVS